MSVQAEAMREALSQVCREAPEEKTLWGLTGGGAVVPFSTSVIHVVDLSAKSNAAQSLARLERSDLLDGFLDSLEESSELTRDGMHRAFARQ